MSSGDTREAAAYDDTFAPDGVFTAGMAREMQQDLSQRIQMISPASSEQVNASSFLLGQTPVPVALYDRNRKQLSLIADQPVIVGEKENVNSGDGFYLPANTLLQLQTVDEVWVRMQASSGTARVSRIAERQGGDVR